MENKGDLVLFSDFSRRGIPRFARNDGVFGMVPRRSEKRRQAAALKPGAPRMQDKPSALSYREQVRPVFYFPFSNFYFLRVARAIGIIAGGYGAESGNKTRAV
jgi:hypothetical protein